MGLCFLHASCNGMGIGHGYNVFVIFMASNGMRVHNAAPLCSIHACKQSVEMHSVTISLPFKRKQISDAMVQFRHGALGPVNSISDE